MLRSVRGVRQFAGPCSSIMKGVWKLRKQLWQPHRSSRRVTTHSNSSSTLGSSPGVVEKRILGVFSLRASDDHHDDNRQPQHHPPFFAHQGYDHRGPPRFLRYTSVASL